MNALEFVGISDKVDNADLENQIFDKAGIRVTNRDFHAVHRLYNKSIVIAKLVNRKDSFALLKQRKIFRDLDEQEKGELSVRNKLYINESLCPAYRVLLGKCNALYKCSRIQGFYTSNGSLMIKTGGQKNGKGDWIGCDVSKIGHISDLEQRFGKTFMNTLIRKI